VFLALALGGQAPGPGAEISTAVVPDGSNAVLTIANFVRIKEFILAQGKRGSYGSRTLNPYWEFPGFDVYLESKKQWFGGAIDESEFIELFAIRVAAPVGGVAGPRINYPRVALDENSRGLRVFEYYSRREPQILVQEAEAYFRAALAEIDRLKANGESGKQDAATGK